MVKTAIISDSEIIRNGVSEVFKNSEDISVVEIFSSVEDCLTEHESAAFDVVIIDCFVPRKKMQTGDVSVCTDSMRKLCESAGVVTFSDAATFSRYSMALRAGVRGYCLTTISAEDLIRAVRVVANGGSYMHSEYENMLSADKGTLISYALSNRQQAVLSLMLLGLSNREIAERLYLSTETVKSHIRAILHKLEVRDRTQAVSKVLRDMASDAFYNNIDSDVLLPVFNSLYREDRDSIQ